MSKYWIPFVLSVLCVATCDAQSWVLAEAPVEANAVLPVTSRHDILPVRVKPTVSAAYSSIQILSSADEPGHPEMVSLVTSLQNDPVQIFHYVRNNITYQHYYGSRKGATMTFLEGSGNDYDQCALLVALLKTAGYAPSYRRALQIIPYSNNEGADFAGWTGMSREAFPGLSWDDAWAAEGYGSDPIPLPWPEQSKKNMLAAFRFNSSRGWPSGSHTLLSGGELLELERVWVVLTIAGIEYHLDPSFKMTTRAPSAMVGSAMGYDRAAVLNAAGGSTPNSYTVSNLNEAMLGDHLAGLTQQLVENLRNTADLSVDDFLGRSKLVTQSAGPLPTTPPLELNSVPEVFNAISDGIRTWVYMRLAPGLPEEATVWLPFSYLAGSRLSLGFPNGVPTIYLENEVLLSTSVASQAPYVTLETSFYRPDGVGDLGQSENYRVSPENHFALIYGMTPNGAHVRYRQKLLQGLLHQARQSPGVSFQASGELDYQSIADPTLRHRVVAETLNVIGLQWLFTTRLSQQIIGDLLKVDMQYFHRFGTVGQESAYYIDVGLQMAGFEAMDGITANEHLAFQVAAYFDSAQEHGVLEQMAGSPGSTSTVKILSMANGSNDPLKDELFRVDSSSLPLVKPRLVGYGSSFLTHLDSAVASGTVFLLPENASNTLNSWTGNGYVALSRNTIGMIISGGLNGGFNTLNGWIGDNPNKFHFKNPNVLDAGGSSLFDINWGGTTYDGNLISNDPVDMVYGAYVLESEDLSIGITEPRGMSLVRSYNSHWREQNPAGLGWGWTHNYMMSASVHAALEPALGEASLPEIASAIVGAYVAIEIYRSGTTAKEWAASALVANWTVNNLSNNAVSIQLGKETIQFIRQPNGTFQAPPGSTLSLSRESSTGDHVLQERLGRTWRFAASLNGKVSKITDFDGKEMVFAYEGDRLISTTDAYGRRLTFNYEGSRLSSVSDNAVPSRTVSWAASDGEGNLTAYTDAEGKTWTYLYEDRRITETRDPDGQVIIRNLYDESGRIASQFNQGLADREWKYFWSGSQNVEEDPLGNRTIYHFDSLTRPVGVENSLGHRNVITYNAHSQVVAILTPKGEVTTFEYDSHHNLTLTTDPLGATIKNTWDPLHRLIKQEYFDPDLPDPAVADRSTTWVYHSSNISPRPDAVIDHRGVRVEFTWYPSESPAAGLLETKTQTSSEGNRIHRHFYDSRGMLSRVESPNGEGGIATESFLFNYLGDLESRTDKNGHTFSLTYNRKRQLASSTGPGDAPDYPSAVTRYLYDNAGNLEYVIDPEGRAKRFQYSSTFKVQTVTTGLLATSPGSFDATDAHVVTTNTYDRRDWLATVSGPIEGQVLSHTWDDAGRLKSTTDPLGRVTQFDFDANGQPTTTTDRTSPAQLRTTVVEYNERGQKASLRDARGNDIRYQTNAWGEQTLLTNRRNHSYRFGYLPNGLLASLTTPMGHETRWEYNDRNLLNSVREPSGQTTIFSYDSADRVRQVADAVNTITYQYDANGQPLTIAEDGAITSRTWDPYGRVKTYTDDQGNTLRYRYYANGLLKSQSYPGTPERVVTYTWDRHNRLESVIDWDNRRTTFTYRSDGLLSQITRPNLSTRKQFYDLAGQLIKVEERSPSGIMESLYRMGYDEGGRMVWRFELPVPATALTDALTHATYDADNRLETWAGNEVVHDADGNMIFGPLPGGSEGVYTYNARNQLTAAAGVSYRYDSEGHRTRVTVNETSLHMVVDPHGAALPRVLRRERLSGGPMLAVYAGNLLLYEVEENGNNLSYYHYDQVGNTVALSDTAGAITDRFAYSPYGVTTQLVGTTDTPYRFAGAFGCHTDSNGLVHTRARYYHPELKRFINADPIGFAGGMNWYAYANGNPLMFIDPSGLSAWGDYWGEVGQVFLGYGDAAVGTVQGIATAVAHPIQTAQGVASAVAHPIETYNAISSSVGELSQTSRGQGRMVGEILLTVASGGAAKATSVAGRSSRLTQVTRWGKPGLEAGDWVMTGGKTKLNYGLSGKWQRGGGNQFADFDSGSSFNVPAGDLYRPSGLHPFDGRAKSLVPGQRIYNPSGQGVFSYGESALFNTARLGGIK